MWRIIALCIVTMSLAAAKVTYKDYRLFSIVPTTHEQLELLQFFRKVNGFSYWQEPSLINNEVLLMVSPYKLKKFKDIINISRYIQYDLITDNIQKLIDNTIPENQSQGFDFKSYHTLEEIYNNLDELAKKYPNKVEVVVTGKTYEGRDIKGVKIISGKRKSGVFIEGGLHGREWIAPATVMYVLHQLLTSDNSRVQRVARKHNWFLFPVLNPDGYVYSHTQDRLWSKTRKPSSPTCIGSDPNRNWNFRWNTTGTSNDPCAGNYPGNKPFSEPEMESISNYMSNLNFYVYASFQSFGQKLMIPYAYKFEHYFREVFSGQMSNLIKTAVSKLKKKYNTTYETGSIGDLDGVASGTSADYVSDVLHKHVFVYKLRDDGEYGFLLPPEQIIPTGKEILESLIIIVNKLSRKIKKSNETLNLITDL